jgi:hypothetical protein
MSKSIEEIALNAGFINTSNGLESPFIEGEDLTDNLKLFASLLLAQPEHIEDKLAMVEPVAWMYERQKGDFTERTLSVGFEKNFDGITIPLYTSPPKRKPLSNEDIANLEIQSKTLDTLDYRYGFIEGFLCAEKAHGIGERNSHHKEHHETFGEEV